MVLFSGCPACFPLNPLKPPKREISGGGLLFGMYFWAKQSGWAPYAVNAGVFRVPFLRNSAEMRRIWGHIPILKTNKKGRILRRPRLPKGYVPLSFCPALYTGGRLLQKSRGRLFVFGTSWRTQRSGTRRMATVWGSIQFLNQRLATIDGASRKHANVASESAFFVKMRHEKTKFKLCIPASLLSTGSFWEVQTLQGDPLNQLAFSVIRRIVSFKGLCSNSGFTFPFRNSEMMPSLVNVQP